MAEFNFNNLAINLPDCYKKDERSNNYKILETERSANFGLREYLNEIDRILDIENATGAVLNAYGERFGQPRGKATDAQYRVMIKSKIVRSFSIGNYKDIVDAICFTFACSVDDVLLEETGVMTVELKNIKLDNIIKSGFEVSQVYQLVKSLMPVAVTLSPINVEGTFEFGYGEDDFDENKGFAISEGDQSIGGYFGAIQTSDTTTVLPI